MPLSDVGDVESHRLSPAQYVNAGRFGFIEPRAGWWLPAGGSADRLRHAALQHALSARLRAGAAASGATRRDWQQTTQGVRGKQWWTNWTTGMTWLPMHGLAVVLRAMSPVVLASPDTARVVQGVLADVERVVIGWEKAERPEMFVLRRSRASSLGETIQAPSWASDEGLVGQARELVSAAAATLLAGVCLPEIGWVELSFTDLPGRSARVVGHANEGSACLEAVLPDSWLGLLRRPTDRDRLVLSDGTLIIRDKVGGDRSRFVGLRLVPDSLFDRTWLFTLAPGRRDETGAVLWDEPTPSDRSMATAR